MLIILFRAYTLLPHLSSSTTGSSISSLPSSLRLSPISEMKRNTLHSPLLGELLLGVFPHDRATLTWLSLQSESSARTLRRRTKTPARVHSQYELRSKRLRENSSRVGCSRCFVRRSSRRKTAESFGTCCQHPRLDRSRLSHRFRRRNRHSNFRKSSRLEELLPWSCECHGYDSRSRFDDHTHSSYSELSSLLVVDGVCSRSVLPVYHRYSSNAQALGECPLLQDTRDLLTSFRMMIDESVGHLCWITEHDWFPLLDDFSCRVDCTSSFLSIDDLLVPV